MREARAATPIDVYVIGDDPVRPWNICQQERLRRILAKADVPVRFQPDAPDGATERNVIVNRGDWVFEERVVRALVHRDGVILTARGAEGREVPVAAHVPGALARAAYDCVAAGDLGPCSGLTEISCVDPETLCGYYNDALRKRAAPYVLPLVPGRREAVEERMFAASYKGVTDVVTKYLWPWPALRATRLAARLGLTPNMVTTASFVMVLVATYAFWTGAFWWGLAAAYVMVFLDTVDGKLARVTVTSSRWGNVFDHGIDLIHPPFWYWAWWAGTVATAGAVSGSMAAWLDIALAINVIGYVVGRLIEGLFIRLFGFEMHVWQPIDSKMREITARRNPNLLLLTAGLLAGDPATGFLAVAVWTVVCTLFHAVRLVQAIALRAGRKEIESWMAQPA
ncbi:MAG: CDP-alcohol phosphatidyltransferase family protein [Alphaproteobacteria bacterium]|nr:MAG: CDP-alcohol phosphatidyltransferase family protein [Alphaproteobacteria bacterium]